MAYGKKKVMSKFLGDYSVCLLGESGIGKTTMMVNTCEREFGDDGYMIFNVGKEQGVDCIDGAVYEDIEDWRKFDAVTKDIIENKDTDYPDLRVVVVDTLDQLIEITEPEVIRRYNNENMGNKDFKAAKTINGAYGGFGRGEDMVIKILLDRFWDLQNAGVRVWFTGHVKNREILDPVTNSTYTSITTNMMTRYFNAFRTKMHVVGVACIDRRIEEEGTGRKNLVTRKEITVNRVKEERRKIVFRDDNYSVDSKSRFANIVNEIPMTTDAFIKALKDAIANSSRPTEAKAEKPSRAKAEKPAPVMPPLPGDDPVKEQEDELPFTDPAVAKEPEPEEIDELFDLDEDEDDEEETFDVAAKIADIKTVYRDSPVQKKREVKAILLSVGKKTLENDIPIEKLKEIMDVLGVA